MSSTTPPHPIGHGATIGLTRSDDTGRVVAVAPQPERQAGSEAPSAGDAPLVVAVSPNLGVPGS
jgi:hypothetical protein